MTIPSPYSGKQQFVALVGFLALCLGVGALGGLATGPAVESWYPTLVLPSWRPLNAAFPIVWTLLYAMMAIAAWRVWRAKPLATIKTALGLFALQLVLNCAWSFLFFGMQNPGLGLLDIVPLLVAIAATTLQFRRHDSLAALLMLPYLLWVAFATALNAAIYLMN